MTRCSFLVVAVINCRDHCDLDDAKPLFALVDKQKYMESQSNDQIFGRYGRAADVVSFFAILLCKRSSV